MVREYNILKNEIHVLITEEGWHDNHRSYHEEDATCKHQDALGDVALVVVHLDVYLQGRNDNHDGGHGIEDVNRIDHHRSDKGGCLCQAVSTPGIVHSSAFGRSRLADGHRQKGKEYSEWDVFSSW